MVLGVIGVGGLVFQFATGYIDEFTKTLDDLKARVSALESAPASTSSSGTSAATTAAINTLTTDLAALTAKEAATCAKVR